MILHLICQCAVLQLEGTSMQRSALIKPLKSILIFYIIVTSNLVFAGTLDNAIDTKEKLDLSLENIRAENGVPAMAVGIIENGEIYYQNGFGLTSAEQAVTSKTKFRVASLTKLFTAQAVMQLVEDEKINLNDKIGKYLPEFDGEDLTIIELMTHHSGLKDKLKPKNQSKQRSISQYLQQSIAEQRSLTKSFEYADLNFNVLGAVVSKVSGKPYSSYINDHIIRPIQLTNTGFMQLGDSFSPEVEPYINDVIN
ncbi:hypothetical protein SOPP22_10910 [Shewanella sp. OPT22]|nr:hypothetical protein SOPP22_10910 [Shewanella sp. OPT22]